MNEASKAYIFFLLLIVVLLGNITVALWRMNVVMNQNDHCAAPKTDASKMYYVPKKLSGFM